MKGVAQVVGLIFMVKWAFEIQILHCFDEIMKEVFRNISLTNIVFRGTKDAFVTYVLSPREAH